MKKDQEVHAMEQLTVGFYVFLCFQHIETQKLTCVRFSAEF